MLRSTVPTSKRENVRTIVPSFIGQPDKHRFIRLIVIESRGPELLQPMQLVAGRNALVRGAGLFLHRTIRDD